MIYFIETGREFWLPFLKGLLKRVGIDKLDLSKLSVEKYATRRAE